MKHPILATLSAAALAISGLGAIVLWPSHDAQAEAAQTLYTQIFTIDNMTCAMCPVTVRTAMEHVRGVKSVKVDFAAKTATVVFDPAHTTIAAIAEASTNAGYPAHASAGKKR